MRESCALLTPAQERPSRFFPFRLFVACKHLPEEEPEHVKVQTTKLRINRTHDSRAKKYSLYPGRSWYGGSLSAVDTRAGPERGHRFFPLARPHILRDWRVHLLLVCIRFRLIRERHPGSNRCAEKAGPPRPVSLLAKSHVRRCAHRDLQLGNPLSEHRGCSVRNRRRVLLLFVRRIFRRTDSEEEVRHRVRTVLRRSCSMVIPVTQRRFGDPRLVRQALGQLKPHRSMSASTGRESAHPAPSGRSPK